MLTAMIRYRNIFFLLLLMLLPLSAMAQTKRALVIGLGEQMDKNWAKINGDNDVPHVVSMLKAGGYKDIRTLVNSKATKKGIVDAFRTLTASCRRGDIVYIHYSGHGQQVTDVSGDEPDGKDESWIPYDAYRRPCSHDRGEKHLIDDEVYVLLSNIRAKVGDTGKILVVVDACHSGGSTREAEEESDDDSSSDEEERETLRGVADVFDMIVGTIKGLYYGNSHGPERWITISACKDNETNAEMKTPKVGKLTYALSTIVSEKRPGSNSAFDTELRRFFNRYRGRNVQSPTITGEKSKYSIISILR